MAKQSATPAEVTQVLHAVASQAGAAVSNWKHVEKGAGDVCIGVSHRCSPSTPLFSLTTASVFIIFVSS
jgi:hypothetical protein